MKNDKGVKVDLLRVEGDEKINISDLVARETDLTIFANQKKIVTLNCSPGNDRHLGIGFLFTSGILRKKEDLISVKLGRKSIHIEIKNLSLPVNEMIGSNQLVEIQQQLPNQNKSNPAMDKNSKIHSRTIYSLVAEMQERAVIFKQSGGVHSCALTDTHGSILLFCEDISRYNTVDQILGEALLKKMNTNDKVMITSCRITYGIIKKIMIGNIPIVISRSAPTDYAIRLAHQKGLTLIGFARGERMNIYTHPERIDH